MEKNVSFLKKHDMATVVKDVSTHIQNTKHIGEGHIGEHEEKNTIHILHSLLVIVQL